MQAVPYSIFPTMACIVRIRKAHLCGLCLILPAPGDILKMFLQVRLPENDCQVHKFLWRDLKTSEELSTYVLLRVNFCDKPSADMASYLLLKIAEEHRESAPEAAEIDIYQARQIYRRPDSLLSIN